MAVINVGRRLAARGRATRGLGAGQLLNGRRRLQENATHDVVLFDCSGECAISRGFLVYHTVRLCFRRLLPVAPTSATAYTTGPSVCVWAVPGGRGPYSVRGSYLESRTRTPSRPGKLKLYNQKSHTPHAKAQAVPHAPVDLVRSPAPPHTALYTSTFTRVRYIRFMIDI